MSVGWQEPPEERRCSYVRKDGTRCAKWAMRTSEIQRCHRHGAKAAKGQQHGKFKHGEYSKYMPQRLKERYKEMVEDDKILESLEEVAVCKSRAQDLLERAEEGESGARWKDLKKKFNALKRAQVKKDWPEVNALISDIDQLIEQSTEDYKAWDEAGNWISKAIRIKESERKRLLEEQKMVTVDEVMMLISAVTDSVRKHVEDRKVLGAIQGDLARLTGPSPSRAIEGVSPN
jgi:hypothetical protein